MREEVLEPVVLDDTDIPPNSWVDTLNNAIGVSSRYVALLAAWVAMCGSLFFSEVLGWIPCELCWYQRILMYPLAAILAVGIVRRDVRLHWYVLPLSIIGMGVSMYHYLLIKTDWFPPPPCTSGVSCTVDYLNWFGFINIPLLAFTAFLIITTMMIAWASYQASEALPDAGTASDEDGSVARPVFDGSRIAVGLIIASVVVAFMLGSTFV